MERVLILGGGGREHALGWKLSQSPHIEKIYFSPGNPGTEKIGENVPLSLDDQTQFVSWVREHSVTFVVVAPDSLLERGMVDTCVDASISVFGPTREAAKIEWSKAYAKEVMHAAGIPTAAYRSFTDYKEAYEYSGTQKLPLVIKASGLAFGKGVVIAESSEEVEATLTAFMLDKKHGAAGSEVVIEEFLTGREFSVHALCDGDTFRMFPPAQDHKRIFDRNQGPNTGGMGSIAPLSWVSKPDMDLIGETIVLPLLRELKKRGTPFKGLLFPGLMMTEEGAKVIEFNARFGDPETQSFMRLLESDLLPFLQASARGTLNQLPPLMWRSGVATSIVLASEGYPELPRTGQGISGIERAEHHDDVVVFHAGTTAESGALKTSGGRVLQVSAYAPTLERALERAYDALSEISFEGMQYRKDIGRS